MVLFELASPSKSPHVHGGGERRSAQYRGLARREQPTRRGNVRRLDPDLGRRSGANELDPQRARARGTNSGGPRWLTWRPDGKSLAAGCKDGTVHVWDTGSGQEVRVLAGLKSPVSSVAFSSDGTRVAGWGKDGTIKLWNANTGQLSADVLHPGEVSAGAWSPNDKFFAAGHENGTVTISGTSAGDKIVVLKGHVDLIYDLAWSADSARLASSSGDFTARVLGDRVGEGCAWPRMRHSHGVTSVAWHQDGQRLATGSLDQTVKIWNVASGSEAVTLRGHPDIISSLSWGPDSRLASAGGDGSTRVWTSIGDQESRVSPATAARTTSVAWSPDGKQIASGGDDGYLRIWNPGTLKEVQTLKAHDEGKVIPQFGLIRSLAWSPDSSKLASAGLDGAVKVWEIARGREVFALPPTVGLVWSVTWSPDGSRLAAGSQDGTIRVVNMIDPTQTVHAFQAHEGRDPSGDRRVGVRALAWSPKGDRLASCGFDGLVKVWDSKQGAELVRMKEECPTWVMSVAWSPDGKRLASASAEFLVIAWDAETGRKLSTMHGHNDFVDAVSGAPTGRAWHRRASITRVRIWNRANR